MTIVEARRLSSSAISSGRSINYWVQVSSIDYFSVDLNYLLGLGLAQEYSIDDVPLGIFTIIYLNGDFSPEL